MDVIQNLRLSNLENNRSNNQVIHFSIDDVIAIFQDITKYQDKYETIFENDILKYLKELHEKYGMKVTLYCFYDFAGFNLSECTDKFRDEFEENSDWLKFGFHAYDAESYQNTDANSLGQYYQLVAKQLKRITGCEEEDLSRTVRLDRFTGTEEQIKALYTEYGVDVFLAADDEERESYYLNDEERQVLNEEDMYKDGNITFTPTDIRVENIENLDELYMLLEEHSTENKLVVFTHEYKLSTKVKRFICKIAEYGIKEGLYFSY